MFKRVAAAIVLTVLLLSPAFSARAEERETPSGIPFSELESFVDDYMEEYIGKTAPGAAVTVVSDGEIVFSKGYGYADTENKVPVSASGTVFEYGSVSKVFIWTAIMRLWEEGKIDLQADIREYLPEGFPVELRFDAPVTLIHIMNHTAGFEDYLFDVVLPNAKKTPSFEETLFNCRPEQVYEPGTISAYSNYSAALAAYIVEQVTGRDFYEYVTENVFLPLKMENTSAHPLLEDRPNLAKKRAKGYMALGDGSFAEGGWSYVPLYPVGGLNGTAEDLARFAVSFLPAQSEQSPLFGKRETLDEMLKETRPMGPGVPGFAHGLIEWDGEYRVVGHGGNTAYFSTQFNIVPEDRFGVVILTNAASEMDISLGLTHALTGKRNNTIPEAGEGLPDAKTVAGNYISARRMHNGFLELYAYLNMLTVEAAGPDRIKLSMMGQTSELVQTRPYVFECVRAGGGIFEHHFDTVYFEVENGKVVRMSGDNMPLPEGRSMPGIAASIVLAAASGLFFVIIPVILLIRKLFCRKVKVSAENKNARKLPALLTLCGTALLFNNALLVARMLMDYYRSFSELRPHILLNYPLTLAAGVLTALTLVKFKGDVLTKRQRIFGIAAIVLLAGLIWLLADWQFFTVLN